MTYAIFFVTLQTESLQMLLEILRGVREVSKRVWKGKGNNAPFPRRFGKIRLKTQYIQEHLERIRIKRSASKMIWKCRGQNSEFPKQLGDSENGKQLIKGIRYE